MGMRGAAMIDDNERREIADNLRYEADYPGSPVQYMEQFIGDLRHIILGEYAIQFDYSEMFSRLADLIDPDGGQARDAAKMAGSDSDTWQSLYDDTSGCGESEPDLKEFVRRAKALAERGSDGR